MFKGQLICEFPPKKDKTSPSPTFEEVVYIPLDPIIDRFSRSWEYGDISAREITLSFRLMPSARQARRAKFQITITIGSIIFPHSTYVNITRWHIHMLQDSTHIILKEVHLQRTTNTRVCKLLPKCNLK